jgi:hypothetical protein
LLQGGAAHQQATGFDRQPPFLAKLAGQAGRLSPWSRTICICRTSSAVVGAAGTRLAGLSPPRSRTEAAIENRPQGALRLQQLPCRADRGAGDGDRHRQVQLRHMATWDNLILGGYGYADTKPGSEHRFGSFIADGRVV